MRKRFLTTLLIAVTAISGLTLPAAPAIAATAVTNAAEAPATTLTGPALVRTAAATMRDCPNDPVCCPTGNPNCNGEINIPPTPGDPGNNGHHDPQPCTYQGVEYPCYVPGLGYWVGERCYQIRADPQPDLPMPAGGDPRGAWYVKSCTIFETPTQGMGSIAYIWIVGAGPTPEEAARQVLVTIALHGSTMGIVPDANGSGLVGLAVWMWTEVRDDTWGPFTVSRSVAGIGVTITARATQIVYDMGNGDHVTCTSPGTKYTPAYDRQSSPDCGYKYRLPGHYTVSAITTWHVEWTAGGQNGVIITERGGLGTATEAAVNIQINQLQIVVG
jgi:hypothetical protein